MNNSQLQIEVLKDKKLARANRLFLESQQRLSARLNEKSKTEYARMGFKEPIEQ